MPEVTDVAAHPWDAVIVGTGMGGGTLGYALAKAGMRVLFCERGAANLGKTGGQRGNYPECLYPELPRNHRSKRVLLSRAGREWEEIESRSAARAKRFIPFTGSGGGGSTALYGMALERFFPTDFHPRENYPDAIGAALPECWPISYSTLAPYYDAAERLYRVHGERDPLRNEVSTGALLPPPTFSPGGHELFEFLRRRGMHPYHLPQACEFVPDCNGCQGYLCANACKNDSARICIEPALNQYGAMLLDQCEVVRLEASRHAVTKIVCVRNGAPVTLQAAVVVLAAGALATPKILFNSASATWPNGLANDSGLVGRHLMRHCIDLYVVFPTSQQRTASGNPKEIAFNDFYCVDGTKFGTVQSFGALPPASMMFAGAMQGFSDGPLRRAVPPLNMLGPAMKPLFDWIFSKAVVLAAIMEDLPYADNRVSLRQADADGRARLAFRYRLNDIDRTRLKAFRRKIAALLKPYRMIHIRQAANNQRIAHACGTCRFGLSPKDSVLDANNKAHGLSNLYVVDGSFFPSSGGTNPALTIAANALRVGEHLVREFQGRSSDPGNGAEI